VTSCAKGHPTDIRRISTPEPLVVSVGFAVMRRTQPLLPRPSWLTFDVLGIKPDCNDVFSRA